MIEEIPLVGLLTENHAHNWRGRIWQRVDSIDAAIEYLADGMPAMISVPLSFRIARYPGLNGTGRSIHVEDSQQKQ